MSDSLPKKIGKYDLIRLIGKGGMGEIFLAKDPVCEREVALKRILEKLIRYPTIKKRFLSEAKIAAQLAHPSIIPIYTLHADEDQIYYTMPYVEGDTLKQILKLTRDREKAGDTPHPIGSSIPALIRIFLSVCQAMHYTHSKGFLHRDLKPENIIVGKFGEVMILDWGIALPMGHEDEEESNEVPTSSPHDLTKPGKVVGTVGYMAPERALGQPANEQTDIYSLGVILYQLLTLRLPFIRPSLRDFRKQMKLERWIEPQEVAPHRDIPSQLSHIAKRCLQPDPSKRYESVHEMIEQLENYIEGCPEWIPTTTLKIDHAEDW
ncbi:MAG: protein kinase, partial [Simkania sp.]|nr:protein kinase [Simkania sp.]